MQNLQLWPNPELEIIAEPGRYFVSECAVLATRIIARRKRAVQVHPYHFSFIGRRKRSSMATTVSSDEIVKMYGQAILTS